MKKLLIVYFLLGLISYFGYTILYNSQFDLGLFCDSSTECYSVTKSIIIFNWISILLTICVTYFLLKKKYLSTIVLLASLLFNILKIGSGSTIPFLFILNFFILIIPFKILSVEKSKSLLIFNILLLLFIYLFEFINISEIFYYNKNYLLIESVLYVLITAFLVSNIVISFKNYRGLYN